MRQLVRAVELAGGEAIETTPDILSKLSGKDNPQAVVGVFEELGTTLDMLDRSSSGIWLVAERLRDPGNLGTILRTGDAVGAGGLIWLVSASIRFPSRRCARAWGRCSPCRS